MACKASYIWISTSPRILLLLVVLMEILLSLIKCLEILYAVWKLTRSRSRLKFVVKDELLVTGSADSTVRVWKQSDDRIYNFKHMLDDHTAEVYSASADSWREFQGPVLGNKFDEDEEDQFQRNYYAVVNRTVYFCNGDEQQLFTFDLHKEGFGLVSFPSFVQRKWSDVLDFKGSVAMVFESVSGVDLWTLDDDVS